MGKNVEKENDTERDSFLVVTVRGQTKSLNIQLDTGTAKSVTLNNIVEDHIFRYGSHIGI